MLSFRVHVKLYRIVSYRRAVHGRSQWLWFRYGRPWLSTSASGCVRVFIGRPVSATVDRVGRGVSAGCHCVTIVSCQRQQGLLRCVVGNEATCRLSVGSLDQRCRGQQGVTVPSTVDRRREQGPLLRR